MKKYYYRKTRTVAVGTNGAQGFPATSLAVGLSESHCCNAVRQRELQQDTHCPPLAFACRHRHEHPHTFTYHTHTPQYQYVAHKVAKVVWKR